MFTILRNAALSALIGFGALASLPAPAQAQSGGFYLGFGSGNHGPSVGFHFSDRGRHDYRDRGRQGRDRDYRRGYCSPREAVYKASRMGLRNPRVVGTSHRVVRVEGTRYGHRYHTLTFANSRNCPVLR